MKRNIRIFSFAVATLLVALAACKGNKQTVATTEKAEAPAASQSSLEAPVGLNLGNRAPEIEMKNPGDSLIKLSSLRGKVVLIDFWASWCGPCRAENPAVVKAYNLYHDKKIKKAKGFEIFSVSLDNGKGPWRDAIAKDRLSWPWHVADLQGWNNAAAVQYGVMSIPTNFLIDENGIIVAKGLRGENLLKTLEQMSN